MENCHFINVELIYRQRGAKEICITPSAGISIIPHVGEHVWLSGSLRDESIYKGLPTAYVVEDVCYHVGNRHPKIASDDSVVIYMIDIPTAESRTEIL